MKKLTITDWIDLMAGDTIRICYGGGRNVVCVGDYKVTNVNGLRSVRISGYGCVYNIGMNGSVLGRRGECESGRSWISLVGKYVDVAEVVKGPSWCMIEVMDMMTDGWRLVKVKGRWMLRRGSGELVKERTIRGPVISGLIKRGLILLEDGKWKLTEKGEDELGNV